MLNITNNSKRGFTIVELLIVIVVIAVLAAITIVAFNGVQERAANSKIQSDLKSMVKVIELYKAKYGNYPNTNDTWMYSSANPTTFIPAVAAEFSTTLPQLTKGTLAGGNCYVYRTNATGSEYKLIRLGQPILSASEQAVVPTTQRDQTWVTFTDRYGYWSPGGTF